MRFSRVSVGIAVLVIVMVLTVPSTAAQAQGGGGSQGGAGGTTGGTGGQTSGGTQATTPPGNAGQQQPTFDRGGGSLSGGGSLLLQGEVILDDGTPTPSNIVIERNCDGQSVPVGQTDSKGRFSVELWRRNQNSVADSSMASPAFGDPNTPEPLPGRTGYWARNLTVCFLRAIYPGYVSSVVELAVHRKFNTPDLGTIILTKMGDGSDYTVSMNSKQVPEKAEKAFRSGIKHAQEQKWDKAEQELAKAVDLYPEYAEAWFNLGMVNEAQQEPDDARAAYGKAVAADTTFLRPYIKLAMMDARENKWQDVAQSTAKVLQADPYEFPAAYFLNSVANLNLNNNTEAEKTARKAIDMNLTRTYPQVEHILGLALASQKKFDEASAHLQKYLEIAPNAADASMVREQLAQVESFRAEQPDGAAPAQADDPGQAAPQP